MPGEVGQPYFKSSILELEALFDQGQTHVDTLRTLEHELSYRTTARATKLRSKVSELIAALSVRQMKTAVGGGTGNSQPNSTAAVIAFPKSPARDQLPPPTQKHDRAPASVDPPATENFGDLPSFPKPHGADEPSAILASWIALEALSPQTYRRPEDLAAGDRRCVADISIGRVPWGTGERSRPKKQLYYQVILGSIPMGRATEDLVKAFGDDEERSQRMSEKAAIGAILVDKEGVVLEENGIAVSSFAWALPLALKLNLGALGAWPKIEPKLIEKLDNIVRRFDRDGKPIPLDLPTIDRAHRWLVTQLGLPDHLVDPPTFVLRVYHYYKAKNPPEVSLLNSFFLNDLASCAALVSENASPAGLRRYLGVERPQATVDLLSDRTALEKAVAPAMIPSARWPTPGGHPLVMLQQAAVNLARSELARGPGIITVNGPAGYWEDDFASRCCRSLRPRSGSGDGSLR